MNQADILLPVMALVGWTLCVLLLMPYRRFKAVFAGKVTAADFRYGESSRVPHDVSIPNRNYMNLLEAPVLFYVVSLVAFVTQQADHLLVCLAWGYVGFRVLHSLVHLTYNHVIHRMLLFAASNGVLGVMCAWLWMALLR